MRRLLALLTATAAGLGVGCSTWMPDWHTPSPWTLPRLNRVTGFGSPARPAPSAAERPPTPTEDDANRPTPAGIGPVSGQLDLPIEEAVRLAFENNRNLVVRRFDPAISRAGVPVEQANFDPTVSLTAGLAHSREQTPDTSDASEAASASSGAGGLGGSGLSGTFQRDTSRSSRNENFSTRLTQRLLLGTSWTLTGSWRQTDSDSTRADHVSELGLELVQPLLRNAGLAYNRAAIEIAVRNAELSELQFEEAVMDVAAEIERSYWSLVRAQLDYAVQTELLTRSRRRLTDNRERVRIGARNVDATDLAQNEADVASREERLLAAGNDIDVQRMTLLRLVNPAGRAGYWRLRVRVYAPDLDPSRLPNGPTPEASLELALTARPEVRQAHLGVAVNEQRVLQARNQLLPQLDADFKYAVTGRGRDFAPSQRAAWDAAHGSVEASLRFSVPVGNRAAGARLRSAELTRDRSEANIADVEQRVELEVINALRELDISARRWRAALVTLQKTQAKLELAEEAVRLGKSGFNEFNILQFQDELTTARLTVNQNYVSYLTALTALRRADGSILAVRGLAVAK